MTPEMHEAFERNEEHWRQVVEHAEAVGDLDTVRLCRAILNVIGVVHEWIKESGLINQQRAAVEILDAIERGTRPGTPLEGKKPYNQPYNPYRRGSGCVHRGSE